MKKESTLEERIQIVNDALATDFASNARLWSDRSSSGISVTVVPGDKAKPETFDFEGDASLAGLFVMGLYIGMRLTAIKK